MLTDFYGDDHTLHSGALSQPEATLSRRVIMIIAPAHGDALGCSTFGVCTVQQKHFRSHIHSDRSGTITNRRSSELKLKNKCRPHCSVSYSIAAIARMTAPRTM
jgi:hypothetical protein